MENLNKSLFKRVVKLPNVSEFVALKTGLHEYALMYGIEKVKRITRATKLYESDKANKYLEWQARRLSRYAANREMDKFSQLSLLMIRRSRTFRLLALNRVLPDWFTLPNHKLKGLWRKLSKICNGLNTDLNFKRVWIDKKPGDYARPLGVPTIEWRAFSFMRLDHLERGLKAMQIFQDFQHGGRSGVGVLTCWKALIPRLKQSKYIFEFDLKGFFDNVNHQAILRALIPFGPEVHHWVHEILKASPKSYVLPREEVDVALQNYKDLMSLADRTLHFMKAPRDSVEYITMKEDLIATWMREDPNTFCHTEITFPSETRLEYIYKELMEEKAHYPTRSTEYPYGITEYKEPTLRDRELGRDRWKSLGIPGKGVPQGLGTSPLLSTILTDIYLKEMKDNLLMYMDDGLIFANDQEQLENLITRMKNLCKSFGVEMAMEKSGIIKKDNKWVKSSRFLGLRYIPERDTITSDTRSGTSIEFPARSSWTEIADVLKQENMNVSDTKRKFENLINLKAYEAGLKHGFLGCLISEAQTPGLKTLDERRLEILLGQLRSWAKINKSQSGFIWKYQDMIEVKTNLTNASSISVYKFLRFIRRRGKFGWR